MIETERLLLTPHSATQLEILHPILTNATTMGFWPRPFTPQEATGWAERAAAHHAEFGFGRMVARLRRTGEVIGDCGIMRTTVNGQAVVDLGYIIHHPHWGHGYATEAATALRDHAFGTLGLQWLHANMAFDHTASRHVAEKIGMVRVDEFLNERNRGIHTFLYALENPATA